MMAGHKRRYTFTLKPEIVERARQAAGYVPLSRWVENAILAFLPPTNPSKESIPKHDDNCLMEKA